MTEKSMRDYYIARTREYDSVYAKPERQTDLRLIERWIPPLFSGRNVLEIACGTGYWTQFFAPHADHVVATDAAEEMLKIARRRTNMEKVEFRVADAYALSEQLGLFNAAFAGFWISHVPKQRLREFLTGFHARLKPGSVVLFLDNLYVEGSSTPIAGRDISGNTHQTRKLLNGALHRVLKNFPSENDLTKMIEGLGAKPFYRKFSYYWALKYESIKS